MKKSHEHRNRNKEPVKNGRLQRIVGTITGACVIILLVGLVIMLNNHQEHSVYQQIVKYGYTGTQEQWLASLVGEEVHSGKARTGYELACENGYDASLEIWLKTLTGVSVKNTEQTPYEIVCENGFEGTLIEWLTDIAEKPETLGISASEEDNTQYELACEYGYSGTFIEWLVSLTHDRVFK